MMNIPADEFGLAILELDLSGQVVVASRPAEQLLRATAGGLAGRRWDTLFATPSWSDLVAESRRAEPVEAALADGADRVVVIGSRVPVNGGSRWVVWISAAQESSVRAAERAELERLQRLLAEAQAGQRKAERVRREMVDAGGGPVLVGSSAPMLAMMERVRRVAPVDSTVLIIGETGSGKELVARTIHAESTRAEAPMIAVNCAAMPDTLIESELFGHERGAFTGADRQRLGKFELADGGTLFLDEVAELSPAAQAKLLRVLQDGTFERVGGAATVRVNVRVVAATHRDLAVQVRRQRFREDLFYRLSVFRIDVPALRERREDIRALAEFLHAKHARRMGRIIMPISERSLRRLHAYRWPGNVRELENAIERATLLADPQAQSELDVELPTGGGASASEDAASPRSAIPRDVLLDLTHDQLQRLQIMHALETSNYRVYGRGAAADKLGLKPQTLLSRMDKLGIPRPRAVRKAVRARSSTSRDHR